LTEIHSKEAFFPAAQSFRKLILRRTRTFLTKLFNFAILCEIFANAAIIFITPVERENDTWTKKKKRKRDRRNFRKPESGLMAAPRSGDNIAAARALRAFYSIYRKFRKLESVDGPRTNYDANTPGIGGARGTGGGERSRIKHEQSGPRPRESAAVGGPRLHLCAG